jgi:nitronate monooxygenase
LAVNVLVAVPEHVDLVEVAAQHVRVIDFFWGDPSERLVALAHEGGALASWQVGSVAEARAAEDAGCDIVVAQGSEAGGHLRGTLPMFDLLDKVLDTVNVPVIASGGIGSARMLAAVLAAGADGARIGTRFASALETAAHPEYVKALADAENEDSVETSAFSVDCPLCPSTHRVLQSAVEAAAHAGEIIGQIPARGEQLPVPRYSFIPPLVGMSGQIGAMALYAGRGVGHCRHGQSAAEILDELVLGAEELLRTAGRLAAT